MHSFWQRVERFSHRLTPAVLTTFMVFLSAVQLHIPGLGQVMPALTLINIYYWGVFYPGILPYPFLFLLGLLEDSLAGTPLGLSSFINVLFALTLILQRRIFGKTLFATVWIGFAALLLLALFIQWLLLCFYYSRMLPIGSHTLQWAMTCLVYPLLHLLLTRVYRAMVRT